ncbi:MAG: dihydrofolate reductase [Filomicrobium sp.]
MTTTNSRCSQSPVAGPDTETSAPNEQSSGDVKLTFVVAVAENGVIGRDGDMPWRLSSDLKLFRRLTMGKPIVMGRRTWQSLPKKPLDGRENIVVTRDPVFLAEGAHVCTSAEEALSLGYQLAAREGVSEVVIIGGAAIYQEFLDRADRIYWSAVLGSPQGDTTFPDFDLSKWKVVSEEPIPQGKSDDFATVLRVLERV